MENGEFERRDLRTVQVENENEALTLLGELGETTRKQH
jgi:hypothetical protein